jgi:hypothetical protein
MNFTDLTTARMPGKCTMCTTCRHSEASHRSHCKMIGIFRMSPCPRTTKRLVLCVNVLWQELLDPLRVFGTWILPSSGYSLLGQGCEPAVAPSELLHGCWKMRDRPRIRTQALHIPLLRLDTQFVCTSVDELHDEIRHLHIRNTFFSLSFEASNFDLSTAEVWQETRRTW